MNFDKEYNKKYRAKLFHLQSLFLSANANERIDLFNQMQAIAIEFLKEPNAKEYLIKKDANYNKYYFVYLFLTHILKQETNDFNKK